MTVILGVTTAMNVPYTENQQDIRGVVYQANTRRYLVQRQIHNQSHRQIRMEDKYTNTNAQPTNPHTDKYTRCLCHYNSSVRSFVSHPILARYNNQVLNKQDGCEENEW